MDENQSVVSNSPRKYLTAKEKFAIVKEQLTTKTGVTEICKKYGIVASQFYRWQELFFKGALECLESGKRNSVLAGRVDTETQVQRLEIERLRNVVLEFAAENVQLKKSPGML